MHVSSDVFHRELNRVAYLFIELQLLELVLWIDVLGRAEDAFVTEQFLSFLLRDDLLWILL